MTGFTTNRSHNESCVTMCNEKALNPVQTWLPDFSAVCHYTKFGMASNKLSKIAADMKSDVGRIPGSVPTLAYVEWASNDSEACSQWLQLFLNYKKACQEMTNS